jgi:arylsulfatase
VPEGGAEGVVCSFGDLTGGFVLYAKDGRLAFTCSRAGEVDRVVADAPLAPGRRTVGVCFRPGEGEHGSLGLIEDGKETAAVPLGGAWPVAFQHGGAGLTLGRDRGLPVDRAYQVPFAWNGDLHEVVIDTAAVPVPDLDTELRTALHSD